MEMNATGCELVYTGLGMYTLRITKDGKVLKEIQKITLSKAIEIMRGCLDE